MMNHKYNIPCANILHPGKIGQKTIVVLGAYRGGTSYIAQRLYMMGIPIGIDYDPSLAEDYSNYEDYEIVIELRDGEKVKERLNDKLLTIIEARNKNSIWGFKWPGTVFNLSELLPAIRYPHLIIVIRDPLASWQSDIIRNGTITKKTAIHHLNSLWQLIEKPYCPTLAVSYERAKIVPDELDEYIKKFIHYGM